MRMLRMLSLALVLALLLPLVALGDTPGFQETGYPIVTEPITLTVFGQRDQNQAEWKDVMMLNKYAELSGVTMDWQEIPAQGFDEKKALLFAGNELPDVFVRCQLNAEEVVNYGVVSGQISPLDELIDKYAPNLKALLDANPTIKRALTAPDGKIYTVPAINLSDTGLIGFKQWINKDWLAKVGKEVPTTPAELKDVLIAFRDGDPNGNGEKDEIPLGIREPSSIYALGGSFGLQNQLRDTYNVDENGKVHNWLADDNFKEYLMFLNELYTEKLLWQEYYTNDRPLWRSNLSNALFGAMYMPYSDVFLGVENQFIGYAPLVGPHGDQIWADANTGLDTLGAFAISNTCKSPEVAMRWVDYFFSEEGTLAFAYGVEGETYTIDEKGMPRFKPEILTAPEGFMTALGKINLVPGGGFPRLTNNNTDGVVASDLTKEVSALLVPYLPKTVYAKPPVSVEDMDTVTAIMQDLVPYRDSSVSKFVLGEWGFDKWDEYVKTLEQIGLSQLDVIYQKALDAQ